MIIQQLKFFILADIQNWLYFTYFYVYYIPFFFVLFSIYNEGFKMFLVVW